MAIITIKKPDQQQAWGSVPFSKKQHLFAVRRDKPTLMVDLFGHKLNGVTYTDDDGDTYIEVELRNGIAREIEIQEPATIRSISANLRHPQSLWSPADQISEYGPDCYDLVIVPICPVPCEQRFELHHALFGETRKLEKFVGYGDDGSVIDRETPVTIRKAIEQYMLYKLSKTDDANSYWTATFSESGCPNGCGADPKLDGYVGGEDGTDPVLFQTNDAFSTLTPVATGLSAGSIITDIYSDANILLVGHADDGVPTASTAGGIRYSADGTTFANAIDTATGTAITTPIHFVKRAGNFWIAGGGAKVWRSDNGTAWTEIPNTATTPKFTDADYDTELMSVLIVGASTTNPLAFVYTDGVLTDITADTTATTALHTAKVLGAGHWMIGGASGQIREVYDYQGGGTWSGQNYSSTGTDIVGAIAGNSYYTIFAVENKLFHRSPVTDMEIRPLSTNLTITGDITDIVEAYAPKGYIKRMRAVTTAGEIIFLEDCRPDLNTILAES